MILFEPVKAFHLRFLEQLSTKETVSDKTAFGGLNL